MPVVTVLRSGVDSGTLTASDRVISPPYQEKFASEPHDHASLVAREGAALERLARHGTLRPWMHCCGPYNRNSSDREVQTAWPNRAPPGACCQNEPDRPGTETRLACRLNGDTSSALSQSTPRRQPMSVESESFKQYCATCHGSGGRGDGPVASALLTRPTDLTRFAFRAGQDGLTAEEVQAGILAILRYLQAIQERPAE